MNLKLKASFLKTADMARVRVSKTALPVRSANRAHYFYRCSTGLPPIWL
eukprot:SAG11_NODE_36726_length_260_cov_0.645963_1_plen_48_part_01